MGRYFVRVVDQTLLPDGKPWMYLDDGGDAYFCISPAGCELTPEVLKATYEKVQGVYGRPLPA